MTRSPLRAALCLTALCFAVACLAIPAAAQAQIARGKYLVEQVALCGDCHTPRDATGQPIAAEALQGAPIGVRPVQPMPFSDIAPKLAGLPANYTPAQFARFLQTGQKPDGSPPLPPMPPYRLSKQDAWAVTDYLKSLK
ncbi:MAG: c-type cytochrome [Acetobacteraceae bacterium]|nr:c-type cytochrome [Acetobacteraceae bacterium]